MSSDVAVFISSFSEGNIMSTLHIVASEEILEIDTNESLSSKTSGNGEVCYTLVNSDFETLKKIEHSIKSNNSTVTIQLSK